MKALCEHNYLYAGVRYAHGKHNRPGSGATTRYYAHVYYCTKCLKETGAPIQGIDDCSYFPVQMGAVQGDPTVVGVPDYDR